MKRLKKLIGVVIFIIIIFFVLFFVYLNIGQYDATGNAMQTYEQNIIEHPKYYEFNNDSTNGLIFYPGAKVDPQAYSYLSEVSNANVYILRPAYNISFLNMNLADVVVEEHKKETKWFVGGHSLGGVVASTYAQNNSSFINGVILLGSYPAQKLENNSIPYLSLYGTNDEVVGDYKEKEELLDQNSDIIAIDGGNHSQFGDYGIQKGDGNSTITMTEQHDFIVAQIEKFINK